MNAIQLLKHDHKTVRGLFRQFAQLGAGAHERKRKTAERTCEELEMHTRIEEEIFYPAVEGSGGDRGTELVAEAREEHQVADDLLGRLKEMTPAEEDYDATFKVLQENVEHHIKEEEGEMFPFTERALEGADLEDLGARMAARKEALMQPGPLTKAKNFVSDALEALTGSAPQKKKPRKRSAGKARTQRARSSSSRSQTAAKPTRTRARRTKTAAKSSARAKNAARKVGRKVTGRKTARKPLKRK
jgi:hypothetical protein